ncbi:MAG: tRNA pseudouridine synthase 1 [Vezdaea aestivalis]|nr:MAG: tRNA pseudouridine synthase 1 [Vezdaea aestivalis]
MTLTGDSQSEKNFSGVPSENVTMQGPDQPLKDITATTSKTPASDPQSLHHKDRRNGGGGQDCNRSKKRKAKEISGTKTNPGSRWERIGEKGEKRRREIAEGKVEKSHFPQFSAEEIAEEDRRPKKKVAVMIGYSGTGYQGMQLVEGGKSIEGDLFNAFVKTGAISKANADDPKKSSLVRCARTDKGVHAACNLISLKLIVEDSDIVEKINAALPPQIRIWGFVRTTNGFSCYQSCDSRIYEYLLPSYALLPPYPKTYLGYKIPEIAKEKGDLEGYNSRQGPLLDFWEETDAALVAPLLASLNDEKRQAVLDALLEPNKSNSKSRQQPDQESEKEKPQDFEKDEPNEFETTEQDETAVEELKDKRPVPELTADSPVDAWVKTVRATHIRAKKAYRVSPERLSQLREALALYRGTHKFHNYTIEKTQQDPSAKRIIKSFTAADPILVGDMEWISLKVHGQSFMMHQIRKMVAMAAMVVRCGCPVERITQSYNELISIPKFPSLGLLLERPIFDNYNSGVAAKFQKEPIDFGLYEKEIEDFKSRELYTKIFEAENESNQFHGWFTGIEAFKQDTYLYLSSGGFEQSTKRKEKQRRE